MTRRKQYKPKRLTTSGDDEDDEDKEKSSDAKTHDADDDTDSIAYDNSPSDEAVLNFDNNNQGTMTAEHTSPGVKVKDVDDLETNHDLDTVGKNVMDKVDNDSDKDMKGYEEIKESENGVDDMDSENVENDTEDIVVKKEKEENLSSPKRNEKTDSKESDRKGESKKGDNVKKEMTDEEIERVVKRELKEAVEIRIPKIRSKRDSDDDKWLGLGSEKSYKSSKRSDTPPLQKLIRHEFSPLKSERNLTHSAKKHFKESSSYSSKDGFTSKLASVIIPSSNISISPKTASHPKQLLSHSIANLRSSSYSAKLPFSTNSLLSRSFPLNQPVFQNQSSSTSSSEDQPLDLSKKPGKSSSGSETNRDSSSSRRKSSDKKTENGMSSTSLQSLQQKFGGDFHLRGLRKPLNYMLYGPEIPALHQALLHTASMALPHFPFPLTNGLPKFTPEKHRHRNSTPSPSGKSKADEPERVTKSVKKEESYVNEKSNTKRDSTEKLESENGTSSADEKQGENYTNHLCTCGKWFDGLYSLSLHLQETGHLPARNKSVSLMEYPKLVRGQDMWLNQESEQTRRILRCIQCGESFKTLPLLTVHMMKTQHYTKIVSSEHTRRTHKCSAYCDKEQDKDCVFKCKVCQETFADMEGLANHMILSGHHKKQSSSRGHGTSIPDSLSSSIHFKKRKRYSFEDTPNPYGNPSIAAMFELKRQTGQISPDLADDIDDGRIMCENCGNKVETKIFVEHVRVCLGQKLREDVAKLEKEKENLKKLERERKRLLSLTEKEKAAIELLKSPTKKVKVEKQKSEDDDNDDDRKVNDRMEEKMDTNIKVEVEDQDESNNGKDHRNESPDERSESNSPPIKYNRDSTQSRLEDSRLEDSDSEIEAGEITDKSKNILREIQSLVDSKSSSFGVKRESGKLDDSESKRSKNVAKKLEIIDPDNGKEEGSSGASALSAMESFIKNSFSNKFDYKKGNIVINPHTSADATIHTAALGASSVGFEGLDYLNRYKTFYAALNLHNGSLRPENDKDKNGDTQDCGKNGMKMGKGGKNKVVGVKSGSDNEEDGRNSVKSETSNSSGLLDTNLETKYLNTDDGEESTKDKGGKSSALDNLSSFVFGQTLTSEHPLDSLQKLITKSDIPRLMAGQGGKFKYLPPHLQMHHANLDLTSPLNLTVKSPKAESEEEETKSRLDEDSLSDYEALNSPANSDGDPLEYRCTACSRRFASKGSYRYHLSRCHLSSVKKFGIKEAFNMSPYVYLPLDHTAKFSKYYEMAKELANKSKETRAKSN